MNADVKVMDHTSYYEISVTGVLSQSTRKGILSLLKCHTSHCTKFLINLLEAEFRRDEPMMGALELVDHMKLVGINENMAISFVSSGAEEHRKFFEGIANESGMNIKYHSSREEALNWLGVI